MYPGRQGAKSPSANGPTNNKPAVISDAQAREKLAVYVYEYLVHVGAKGAAQTFLSEIRWEKSISIGEPPGFLHSWWCVFWDLYCAAPERRDQNDHSGEAKAFHDYSAHAHPPQPTLQDQHPAFQQYFPGPAGPGLPGLPPFGGAHGVRPRVPLQAPGQALFPHGHLDQYRLMRPTAPLIDSSLPPSSSSPLPMPPGGSIAAEMPPQPISVSPGHNHGSHDVTPDPQPIPPVTDYQQLPPPDGQSFVIQKIKESMQEEAKRFNEEKHIPQIESDDAKPREYY